MERFYGRKGELRVTAQRVGDHLASSQRRALHLGRAHVPNTVFQTHARARSADHCVRQLLGGGRPNAPRRRLGAHLHWTPEYSFHPGIFRRPRPGFEGCQTWQLGLALLAQVACEHRFNASSTAFATGGLTDASFATAV